MKKLSQKLALAAFVAIPLVVGSTTKANANEYGSIAFSESTQRYGYSYNYPTQSGAQNRALRECGVRDCRVVVWFKNACGTLAIGNSSWGSAWNANGRQSQISAVRACSQYGSGCRVVRTVCSPQ